MNSTSLLAAAALTAIAGTVTAQAEFGSRGTRTFEPTAASLRIQIPVTLRAPIAAAASVDAYLDNATSSARVGTGGDCELVDASGLPLPSATLSFPAGSPAGTTRIVYVLIHADAGPIEVEAVEHANVRLRNASGVAIGNQSVHVVQIHDVDDYDAGVDLFGSATGLDSFVAIDKGTAATLRRSGPGMRGVSFLEAIARHPSGIWFGVANDGYRFRAPPGIQRTVEGERASELVLVDPLTGDATPLKGLSARGIHSLTWDATGSRLLGCDGEHGDIYSIDTNATTAPTLIGSTPFLRLEGLTVAPAINTAPAADAIYGVRSLFVFPSTVPPLPVSSEPAALFEVDYSFGGLDTELLAFSGVTGSAADAALRATGLAHDPVSDRFYVSVLTANFVWQIWTYDRSAIVPGGSAGYVAPLAMSANLPNPVGGLFFDSSTGLLRATELGTNQLVTIDPASGVVTRPNGGTAATDDITAMAMVEGQLFGVDMGRNGLVRVDRSIGTVTPVGSAFTLPDLSGNGLGDESIQGLAYDDQNQRLYGLAFDNEFSPVCAIAEIDPVTGVATIVSTNVPSARRCLAFVPGAAGVADSLYSCTPSGGSSPDKMWRYDLTAGIWVGVGAVEDAAGTAYQDVRGLTYDAATATLHGSSMFGSDGDTTLVSFSLAAGPSALVTSAQVSGAKWSQALAFDAASGRLWAENLHGHLFDLDPATAAARSVGSFGCGQDGRPGLNGLVSIAGSVYGIDAAGGGSDLFVEVDRATGETTTVGPARLVNMAGAFVDGRVDCLTNVLGTIYGVHNSGTPGAWVQRLVTIDETTGALTEVNLISGISGFERVTGLAWTGSTLHAVATGDYFGTAANYFATVYTIDVASGSATPLVTDFPASPTMSLFSNGGLAFDGFYLYATVECAAAGATVLDRLIRIDISTTGAGFVNAEVVGRPSHSLIQALTFVDRRACFPFLRGDVNMDGVINMADANYLLAALFVAGSPQPPSQDAADANDSGSVEIADAMYILNYLFSNGPQPPAPFPAPGQDPTPDGLGC